METVILGIDPGIERLGWSVLKKDRKIIYVASGVKKTSPKESVGARILILYKFLEEIIQEYHPSVMGVEKLFFSKNIKTAMVISEVRGVILLAAENNNMLVREFTPLQVKMFVCGDGSADKKQVARMMGLALTLPQRTMIDDETDALAIGYAASL